LVLPFGWDLPGFGHPAGEVDLEDGLQWMLQ
jgi:hypothetical protein